MWGRNNIMGPPSHLFTLRHTEADDISPSFIVGQPQYRDCMWPTEQESSWTTEPDTCHVHVWWLKCPFLVLWALSAMLAIWVPYGWLVSKTSNLWSQVSQLPRGGWEMSKKYTCLCYTLRCGGCFIAMSQHNMTKIQSRRRHRSNSTAKTGSRRGKRRTHCH